jgi:hypothetical protein
MTHHKGFATASVLLVILILLVLGGAGYVAINPGAMQKLEGKTESSNAAATSTKASISWSFTSAAEVDGIPYTNVTAVINGKSYSTGTFQGSCSEVGASGGIDGKGLLAGELAAAQCWYAGGGDEIGVFANEDGGYEIMTGALSEGDAETPGFRGDFKIKTQIAL